MIIHSAKEQPFCIRVEYSHEIGVLKNTRETSKFMADFKNTFRIKKSQSMSKMVRRDDNYNKYYINPQQRYLKKSADPRKEIPENEQFIYNNLHNEKFNTWRHPFESKTQSSRLQRLQLSDDHIKNLTKFKAHMESVKKTRIPLLVDEFIHSRP